MNILLHYTHYVSLLFIFLSISYFLSITHSIESNLATKSIIYNNDYSYNHNYDNQDTINNEGDFQHDSDDDLNDYTLYYHQYEFNWDDADDWQPDEDYTKQQLPHACTHKLEVLNHKLCVIGKSLSRAQKDLPQKHRVVNGHPVADKNGGFVINFKKHDGKELFKLHHINTKEMDHIFYNKPHPHIMTREELEDAIRNGKINNMGNTFSVTYHGLVFDFIKNKDWRKIGAHHTPRYMDNMHIRPKLVQNNDPAPQIQDRLDNEWEELDHYNNFVKEMSYSRKRYKGPKLVIPPGTQNAAWPSDPHHALNLVIPNKRPRGAPRIKDLPGNWNKMWGRTPEADYLDYGTVFPQKENQNLAHRQKNAVPSYKEHPARVKKELGEAEHPLFQMGHAPNTMPSKGGKKAQLHTNEKKKKEVYMKDDSKFVFGNVPTTKDAKGNVYVRPGMTNMNDNIDADGKQDSDYNKDNYKEHNVADSGHFGGLSNPMMMNLMMQNPGLRMIMPFGGNSGRGMGLHKMMNSYARMYGMNPHMMQMMQMLQSPYVHQALPYMMMGYNPNLFGHGMPIYHGSRFENQPLSHSQHHAMAHQDIQNMYEPQATGSVPLYANGDKGPLHSPWRVKMRRCRLKNGQRVIFPASQVNMDKFHQICDYDPNAPPAKYSVDIDVPPASRFNHGGGSMHPFHYGAHHAMTMPMMPPMGGMMGGMMGMNPMMGGMGSMGMSPYGMGMNPMMGGMSMMHPSAMMHPGMMNSGMMHPGMMAGGMMHPGMMGGGLANVHHHFPANGMDHHFSGSGHPDINIYGDNAPKEEAKAPPTPQPTEPSSTTTTTTTSTTTAAPKPPNTEHDEYGSAYSPSGMMHMGSYGSGMRGMGMNPYSMMGGMNMMNPYHMMHPAMMSGGMMHPGMMGGMSHYGMGMSPYHMGGMGMNPYMMRGYSGMGMNPYMNHMMGGYHHPMAGYTDPYTSMYGGMHHTAATATDNKAASAKYDTYGDDIYDVYHEDDNDEPTMTQFTNQNGEKHIHIYHQHPIPPMMHMGSMMPPSMPMMMPPMMSMPMMPPFMPSNPYMSSPHYQNIPKPLPPMKPPLPPKKPRFKPPQPPLPPLPIAPAPQTIIIQKRPPKIPPPQPQRRPPPQQAPLANLNPMLNQMQNPMKQMQNPMLNQQNPMMNQMQNPMMNQMQNPMMNPMANNGPSRIIAVPAPGFGGGSGYHPAHHSNAKRRYERRMKRMKRREQRQIDRLKKELRRSRRSRRSHISHHFRCDRCGSHRCHPVCGTPSCTTCYSQGGCDASCDHQPSMYAVQSYGFQMAGNPPMPYGVAYAYPVSYHDMKIPVIHGAMMHPATGMIHPYTALPHPAIFGPRQMFGMPHAGTDPLVPQPQAGAQQPQQQQQQQQTSAAAIAPDNKAGAAAAGSTKAGAYGSGIHDPMLGGTMVPPVTGGSLLMNAMSPMSMSMGAPMLPMYPRYQVAYPVYHVKQNIHHMPMGGGMNGMSGMGMMGGGMGGMMGHPMGMGGMGGMMGGMGMHGGMGMNPMSGGMGMGGMGMHHPMSGMSGMGMQHPMSGGMSGMGMGGMHPMGGMGMQHPMGGMGMHPMGGGMGMGGMGGMSGMHPMNSGMGTHPMHPMNNPMHPMHPMNSGMMGGMSGMGMHPYNNGMMGGYGTGTNHMQANIAFNGQNSMLPPSGEIEKCQPLHHMKICTIYDRANNKLQINVKVGKTKRKKKKKKHEKSDRYKLEKKAGSDDIFPQFRNPFKSKKKTARAIPKAHKPPPKSTKKAAATPKAPPAPKGKTAAKAPAKPAAKTPPAAKAAAAAYIDEMYYYEDEKEQEQNLMHDGNGEFYLNFNVMESEQEIQDELNALLDDYDEEYQEYYYTANAAEDYDNDYYGDDEDEYLYQYDDDEYLYEYDDGDDDAYHDEAYAYDDHEYYEDSDDAYSAYTKTYDDSMDIDYEFDDAAFNDRYFTHLFGDQEDNDAMIDYEDELDAVNEDAAQDEENEFSDDELHELEEYLDYAQYLDDVYKEEGATYFSDDFYDTLARIDDDYATNHYDSLMDSAEFEGNVMNWRDWDDLDGWIETFEHEASPPISDQLLTNDFQHKDDALFLDYGSFIDYDDHYNFEWNDDAQWRSVYNTHEDKSVVNTMGVRDGKRCTAIIPFLQSKVCLDMNDFKINLHLRAASKPELHDMYHANYVNQFDTYATYDEPQHNNNNERDPKRRRLYDKYHAFTYNDDQNAHYYDDEEYDDAQLNDEYEYDYDSIDTNEQQEYENEFNSNSIQMANMYSASNSFDYNEAPGFYDDAGNFYDRNAMRELLNFHFEDGLDLNDDDDWDEVTITTTKAKHDPHHVSKAHALEADAYDNYYDEAYMEDGFKGKGNYYKRQATLSEEEQSGMHDEHFLNSIREMVQNMKQGTLAFGTSMQRGLPVHLPDVFQKIRKCVSADPLFKLCFTVNPQKKWVHIKVRVPAFKRAIDSALKSADLTTFQQRMFGTKVGNALHDIAKRIEIPSVEDVLKGMKRKDAKKESELKEEGRSIAKIQEDVLKMLNPKQKERFRKLTANGIFKVRCGSGRRGRQCRRRKAALYRKIARKVAGRRLYRRRRPRGRRRRRRRRRKPRSGTKPHKHLKKFKVFNDRYRKWYKNYYQTWYQKHISGPYYQRVINNRHSEREKMRNRVRHYKRQRAFKSLLKGDKHAIGHEADTMTRRIHKTRAKETRERQRDIRVDRRVKEEKKVIKEPAAVEEKAAEPKKEEKKAEEKKPEAKTPEEKKPEAKKPEAKAAAIEDDYSGYLYYDEHDDKQEIEDMIDDDEYDEFVGGYYDDENDGYYDDVEANEDVDDYYDEYDDDNNKEEEEDEEIENSRVFGFGHRILISSTSFWILQISSILFGGLIVLCVTCFFAMMRYQKEGEMDNIYQFEFGFNPFQKETASKPLCAKNESSSSESDTETESDDSSSSESATEYADNDEIACVEPGHPQHPEILSDANSNEPMIQHLSDW